MSTMQDAWLEQYLQCFNATQAAREVGYKWPNKKGPQLKKELESVIAERLQEMAMTAEEAAKRMADAARFDISPYLEGSGRQTWLNVEKLKGDGYGWVIKGLKYNSQGAPLYDTWDSQRALEKIYDNVNPQVGDKERPAYVKYITENRPDDSNDE